MGVKGSLWYRFILTVAKGLFGLLGGVTVEGKEHVPLEGPLILSPIHCSYLDPPLVACASPRAITFMAKEELFKGFLLGPLIRSLGAFPIQRSGNDTAAVRKAIELLKEGRAVIVFPEGTRGFGEQMGPLTPGTAMLAKQSGAKVLPIGINGTHRAWPKNSKKIRRTHLRVVIGQPFTYEEVATGSSEKENREIFARLLAAKIAELTSKAGLPMCVDPSNE